MQHDTKMSVVIAAILSASNASDVVLIEIVKQKQFTDTMLLYTEHVVIVIV